MIRILPRTEEEVKNYIPCVAIMDPSDWTNKEWEMELLEFTEANPDFTEMKWALHVKDLFEGKVTELVS